MINALAFIKEPVSFFGICKIYPPTVREVLTNQSLFDQYNSLLTMSHEDIEDEYIEKKKDLKNVITPYQYLFNIIEKNEEFVKAAFKFFIKEDVTFIQDEKLIIIGDLKDSLISISELKQLRIIHEGIYFEFQNILRTALGHKIKEAPNPNEHPKIKQMKAKARYRDRIKAKRGLSLSLPSSLVCICCMGIGLTPLNIGEISYAAINPLIEVYQTRESYDIGVKQLIAGADAKKVDLKYWIANIE